MFIQKMDFRMTDPKDWTYENFDFRNDMNISEDGSEITLVYNARNAETNPNGFSGYGFQNVNVYKYFVQSDAIRMKVKYTGTGANANFYFRILEEDNDRWQFTIRKPSVCRRPRSMRPALRSTSIPIGPCRRTAAA